MRTPDDGVLHLWRRTACLPVVKRARRLTGRQEGETRATLFIWREARVGFLKRKVTTLQIVQSDRQRYLNGIGIPEPIFSRRALENKYEGTFVW